MNPVRLTSRDLVLRPVANEVAAGIWARTLDVETVLDGYRAASDYPVEQVGLIRGRIGFPQSRPAGVFVITHEADRLVIGDVCWRIENPGEVSVFWEVVPSYQKQGHGTKAGVAFLEWLRAQDEILCIRADVSPGSPSERVAAAGGLSATNSGLAPVFQTWEWHRPAPPA